MPADRVFQRYATEQRYDRLNFNASLLDGDYP